MATWFGRGRVQERAADSDDRSVPDDARTGPPAHSTETDSDATAPASASPPYATNQDARSLAAAAGALRAERESDRTISALRAATTAAGTQPTLAQITEVRRLHEATLEAARHPRRLGSKAGARRRLEHAIAARTAALHEIGFTSFDEFTAVYGPTLSFDRGEPEADETIARICELLIELGVNPTADPLRAASEFLTAHEAEMRPSEPVPSAPVTVTTGTPEAVRDAPADVGGPASIADDVPAEIAHDAPWFVAARIPPRVEPEAPAPAPEPPPPAPEPDGDVVDRWISAEARAERMHAEVERAQAELASMLARSADLEETAGARVDELEAANEQLRRAHARVEELEASILRLEQTNTALEQSRSGLEQSNTDLVRAKAEAEQSRAATERSRDELERSRADLQESMDRLERSRDELEDAKARSDAEREELERGLAASRARVAELETSIEARERALADADRGRTSARESVDELEAALATSRAELEQNRMRVGELEAELEAMRAAHTAELERANARVAELESEREAHAADLVSTRGELDSERARADELATDLETTRRSLEALDAHAEQVEAELAAARRAVDSLEVRRELDALRTLLEEARHELGHLEVQRAEADRALANDRMELQQLQRTLTTTREQAVAANNDVVDARATVDEILTQVDAAEQARDAITVDAAEVLARAEAQASDLLERANRDAEAIRQQAIIESGAESPRGPAANSGVARFAEDALRALTDRVGRLERKVAKQRRRLDRLTGRGDPSGKTAKGRGGRLPRGGSRANDVVTAAEREAAEIRRAAQRERDAFRAELVGLLSRFAPVDEDED